MNEDLWTALRAAGVAEYAFSLTADGEVIVPDEKAITPTRLAKVRKIVADFADPAAALDRLKASRTAEVNERRDARIAAGFTFEGHPYDYDDKSQKRITGAAALAGFAMGGGSTWPDDFEWIAQDNSLVPMDAQTCFALGQRAAEWETLNVFAARAIKNTIASKSTGAAVEAVNIEEGWPE